MREVFMNLRGLIASFGGMWCPKMAAKKFFLGSHEDLSLNYLNGSKNFIDTSLESSKNGLKAFLRGSNFFAPYAPGFEGSLVSMIFTSILYVNCDHYFPLRT